MKTAKPPARKGGGASGKKRHRCLGVAKAGSKNNKEERGKKERMQRNGTTRGGKTINSANDPRL